MAFAHFTLRFALAAVCGLGVQLYYSSVIQRLAYATVIWVQKYIQTVVRVINNCSAGHVRV